MIPDIVKQTAGYVADVTLLISAVIYMRRILAGRIESSLVTRGIWALVFGMLTIFYWQSTEGTYAIGVSIIYTIVSVAIFILLLAKKKGAHWDWLDKLAVVAIPVILALWYFSGSSPLALWLTLALDVIGTGILVRIQYKAIQSGDLIELPLTFWIDVVANAINLIAIKEWNVVNAVYPLYSLVVVLIIATLASVWVVRWGKRPQVA